MIFYRKNKRDDNEIVNYWLSIGDLMASILILFILLFISKTIDVNKEKLNANEEKLNAKKERELINQKLEEKEKIISEFTGVKRKIISKLLTQFKSENIANEVEIDEKTGAIKIDAKILFNTNEYFLKNDGKQYLKEFIPKYIKVLIGDSEISKEISQIIIEGHTDDVGSYIYNMELSQKRAYEVIRFIYDEMGEFLGKEELTYFITANGRSKIKVIKDSSGNIDRDKSRRVEFLFKLKEDELIKKIDEELKNKIK